RARKPTKLNTARNRPSCDDRKSCPLRVTESRGDFSTLPPGLTYLGKIRFCLTSTSYESVQLVSLPRPRICDAKPKTQVLPCGTVCMTDSESPNSTTLGA
ncbi:unnamed protein product, partial [Amoebophrya sp. A120]